MYTWVQVVMEAGREHWNPWSVQVLGVTQSRYWKLKGYFTRTVGILSHLSSPYFMILFFMFLLLEVKTSFLFCFVFLVFWLVSTPPATALTSSYIFFF